MIMLTWTLPVFQYLLDIDPQELVVGTEHRAAVFTGQNSKYYLLEIAPRQQ
jgi:hypothetical protein